MNVDLLQISEEIAHDLGRPLDHALKMKIKSMIKEQRSFHLRRSYERTRSIHESYLQTFFTPITKQNLNAPYNSSAYDCSSKTLESIPNPLRLDMGSPFHDVYSHDGTILFSYTKLSSLKFNNITTCTKHLPRYVYINGKIYTYFNRNAIIPIQGLLITGVFEDPLSIRDYNNDADYYELNYPMPYDLVSVVKQYIIQSMVNIGNDDKDVTIHGVEQ